MKSLIFGANGQDGYYLNKLLTEQGVETIGVSRSGDWIHADVGNFELVELLITKHCPEYIFQMAANSTTRHDALFENHHTIATGTLNILEAVYRNKLDSKVFITGSGIQFENSGRPITEKDHFNPSSPYATSRIYSVNLARYYRSLGVRTYVGFLFHHESPFRQINHVSKKVIDTVRAIQTGKNELLMLGDISVEKEWTFAGDIVQGIITLIKQDQIFEAVIGSGLGYTIEKWLEICFELIHKDWHDYVILEKGFFPEYNRLVSNPATMFSLGWKPVVDINELAKMMLFT